MNTDTINKFFAAAKEGSYKNIELYLNQGVAIDAIDENGTDALYTALKYGHTNIRASCKKIFFLPKKLLC
jgi:hypothetical protein